MVLMMYCEFLTYDGILWTAVWKKWSKYDEIGMVGSLTDDTTDLTAMGFL